MPDNIAQGAFISIWNSVVRVAQELTLPARELGRPDAKAPAGADPVIVIHGISDSGRGSEDIVRSLRRDGFIAFNPTMPFGGMDGIEPAVAYLRWYIADVLRRTGARKVDIVAHSQGGLHTLAYIRSGGQQAIDAVVSIATPYHGVGAYYRPIIDAVNAVGLLRFITPRGLLQLDERNPFIRSLTAGDETPSDIRYTSIYSRDADGVLAPADSAHLEGAKNIVLEGPGFEWGFGRRRRGVNHVFVNHHDRVYELLRAELIASRRG